MIKVLRYKHGSSPEVIAYSSSFEYSATRMGETFVSLEINSHEPIDFKIGDYVEFRGERFTLNYLPTVEKRSSVGSLGDAFTYKGVKFNGCSDELTRARFLDVVKEDNKVHYSALPRFSFFCSTIKDFIERVQANLDRIYPEQWIVSVEENVPFASNVSIDIDDKSIWEALEMVSSKFKTHFIVRELDGKKRIIIGEESHINNKSLEYGQGNGLVSLERIGEDSQQIITRLRAYGSTKNLPAHYYSEPYEAIYAFDKEGNTQQDGSYRHGEPYKVIYDNLGKDIRLLFPIPFSVNGYREVSFYTKDRKRWSFKMTHYKAREEWKYPFSETWDVAGEGTPQQGTQVRKADKDIFGNSYAVYQSQIHIASYDSLDELNQLYNPIASSDTPPNALLKSELQGLVENLNPVIYLEGNLKKDITGVHLIRRYAKYPVAPDNMSVHHLMLPSFLCYEAIDNGGNKVYLNPANVEPIENSQQDIVAFYYPKDTKNRYEAVIENKNPKVCLDPYIEDVEAVAKYGVREGCRFFDSESEDNVHSGEIYPTIRGVKSKELELAGYSPNLHSEDNGYIDELLIGGVQFYNADGKVTHSEKDEMLPIKDDGIVRDPESGEKEEKPNDTFYVYLKDFGFDLREAVNGENVSLHFTSGMCGERSFELLQQSTNPQKVSVWRKSDGTFSAKSISGAEKISAWKVALKRSYDETLRTWFPNKMYPISGKLEERLRPEDAGISGIKHSDSFLLLGFNLPKMFIDAAAVRLYEAAKEYLNANSRPKYTYAPKFDPVFMERDMALNGSNSLHNRLRVGTILRFRDTDLGIENVGYDESSKSKLKLFIDTLSIKINENGKVSYDISLKEDSEVSTIQKIQNQIVALQSEKQAAVTPSKVKALAMGIAEENFLSNRKNDTAIGHIAFKDGASFGSFEEGFQGIGARIDKEGNAEIQSMKSRKGASFGDFQPGMLGSGGRVDADGNAELQSLAIRQFLEVPELRYNRTSVHIGAAFNSPAAGIIREVRQLTPTTGRVVLKLEEGELGTVEPGDLLMGIFHATAAQGGATKDTDDGRLNLTFAGFRTVYFECTSISADRQSFFYTLRGGTTAHPSPHMTFASRGSRTIAERRQFVIATRSYTRYMVGVDSWEILPKHIMTQLGDLSSLGKADVNGHGLYSQNVFLTGKLLIPGKNRLVEEVIADVERQITDTAAYDQFSPDGVAWHEPPMQEGDLYIRHRRGNEPWSEPIRFVGKDAEQFEIETIEGSTFYRPGQGFVGKFRAVYKVGGKDMTDTLHPSRIVWTRESQGAGDEHWNALHASAPNPITITTDDLVGKTTLVATLYEANGLTNTSSSITI